MTPTALAALEMACFPGARSHWSAVEFEAHMTNPNGITITAENGYATGRVSADEAELISIGVLPATRRGGIGAEILTRFITVAAEKGARNIFLEVSETNAPALALYQKTGFQTVGVRRGYYTASDGSQTDALIMRRQIQP